MTSSVGVQSSIESVLKEALQPEFLSIENESHKHNVPPNSETHFKVVAISNAFTGKRPVARHQLIYGLLATQLKNGVHALALHTFTPEEWKINQEVKSSPDCMGGSKS